MRKVSIYALSLILVGAPSIAQQLEASRATADESSLLGPDDTLTIVALNCEEISKQWRIGTSGDINLPMIGRIRARGKTVEQLEQEVTARLSLFIVEPQVNIFVSDFRSRPVTITGAVVAPGIVQLRGVSTLFNVLALAGGPREKATRVRLSRSLENGQIPYRTAREDLDHKFSVVDLPAKELADGRSLGANIVVKPNDVISVLEQQEPQLVHIVGDVVKPGAVELVNESTVSLMKLLAVAGGLTRTASPQKTVIRHIGAEGVQSETASVNVKKIIEGKAKDLELGSGDIVFVPSSEIKLALQTAPQTALATGFFILARF